MSEKARECKLKGKCNMAKNTNATNIINGPLKLAYERLLSEAFGKISYSIDDSEDKKKYSRLLKQFMCLKEIVI